MIARMSFSPDGRPGSAGTTEQEARPALSPEHVGRMRSQLAQSPASFNMILGQTEQGVLRMEWQCVLQGAGTAYLSLEERTIAVCLLLEGRFGDAERAAVDALQATLHAAKVPGLRDGFEIVRRTSGRSVRAVFLTERLSVDVAGDIHYWADCLAAVFLPASAATDDAATRLAHSA